MTVAFQRMFGILERWNNNQVTPSLSKAHELNLYSCFTEFKKYWLCSKFIFRPIVQTMKIDIRRPISYDCTSQNMNMAEKLSLAIELPV